MPIEHQLLAVNGIDLSLYSAGPADGRPVWLLHGFPECWYAWHPQIEALSQAGYRVFAPEMRGYGQSSAPRDYALSEALNALKAMALQRRAAPAAAQGGKG